MLQTSSKEHLFLPQQSNNNWHLPYCPIYVDINLNKIEKVCQAQTKHVWRDRWWHMTFAAEETFLHFSLLSRILVNSEFKMANFEIRMIVTDFCGEGERLRVRVFTSAMIPAKTVTTFTLTFVGILIIIDRMPWASLIQLNCPCNVEISENSEISLTMIIPLLELDVENHFCLKYF